MGKTGEKMKIEKKEFGSFGDGRLVKTVCIDLIPEDEEDERIIKSNHISKLGDSIYL